MPRLARTLLLTAVALGLVVPSAGAAAPGRLLGNMWTTVLETPTGENPFVTGEAACVEVGSNTVAPFSPTPQDFTCTVRRGTKVFVAAGSWECSSFPGDHFDFGTTEGDLRECAALHDDLDIRSVTVDGQSVTITPIETGLLTIHLPEDNIFGLEGADRSGTSVAHGRGVLLKHLAPGTHTIDIDIAGSVITTTIIVT